MASSIALKKLLSTSSLLNRALRPFTQSASTRLFNTNAARYSDDEDDDSSFEVDRRSAGRSPSDRRGFSPFQDVLVSPISTRSLSQLLNMMDQMNAVPVTSGFGQLPWDIKETKDALYLRADMPGLGKEDVKVSVEQNTLIIKGEGKKEFNEEGGRKVSSRIALPEKMYKTNEIKAEMKNGVLKVVVPKMKEEERTDVVNIKVE